MWKAKDNRKSAEVCELHMCPSSQVDKSLSKKGFRMRFKFEKMRASKVHPMRRAAVLVPGDRTVVLMKSVWRGIWNRNYKLPFEEKSKSHREYLFNCWNQRSRDLIMQTYTRMHHFLIRDVFVLVTASGNRVQFYWFSLSLSSLYRLVFCTHVLRASSHWHMSNCMFSCM